MDESLEFDDDIQFVKVETAKPKTKQKSMTWVSSSFGGFGDGFSAPAAKSCRIKEPASSYSEIKRKRTDADKPGKQTSLFSFPSQKENRKRSRELNDVNFVKPQSNSLNSAASKDIWSEKYKPHHRNDLAVHKKKIEELSDWFTRAKTNIKKHAAPVLLLTGPPGAGKSACVNVLCKELGLHIQEWGKDDTQEADQWVEGGHMHRERSKVDVYTSQSQSSQFQHFLLRANKYQALSLVTSSDSVAGHSAQSESLNSVIVVEELPNTLYRDPAQFHNILRKYRYSGHSPLVIIQTESTSSQSSVQKLLPRELQAELAVATISLNPVASTLLLKLLNRVISQESRQVKFSSSSSSVIEQIASSSNGDIRSALNSLQFACRTDTADIKSIMAAASKGRKKSSKSRTKSTNNKDQGLLGQNSIGVKDATIFLFHAVGKILYFKRGDPSSDINHCRVPDHLAIQDRDPLLVDPEEVWSRCHLSGDMFTSFLHENYVDFLSTVEDLERATEYFSDADYMAALWTAREELQKYSVSVATRGFIHSHSEQTRHDSVRRNHGWRPLHKSQWFTANKQSQENLATAREMFKGYHWEPEVLCTEMMPYLHLTNPTLHDSGQIRFVQDMTHFTSSHQSSRSKKECLNEKDVASDDEESINYLLDRSVPDVNKGKQLPGSWHEDDHVSGSQSKMMNADVEEEILIEEFDD